MLNRTTLMAAVFAVACGLSQAATLRVANQGDALSMDPHSLNESLQLSFTGNIYEPLVARGKQLEMVPALATSWKMASPTVWRFELRKGVSFHDGTPFTADDVVFTFKRAAADGSDMKSYTSPIKDVRKVGELAVEIETMTPFPILPDPKLELAKSYGATNSAFVALIDQSGSLVPNGVYFYRVTVGGGNPAWGKVMVIQ